MQVTKILWLAVIFGISSTAIAQENDNGRFKDWLIKDPGYIVKNFRSDEIAGVFISGVSVAMFSITDEPLSEYLKKELTGSDYLKVTNEFGTFRYVAPASLGIFGISLLSDDQKFQDAAFTSFQSVMNTAVVVNIAKFGVARARPFQDEGSDDFDFFKGAHSSFPSGHSSTAFALFVPWVVYYPNVLTYSMLAIPASTAISRIVEEKHWPSDVLAGAIIGTYFGYTLAKKHLNDAQNSPMTVTPFLMDKGAGISISMAF